MATDQKTRGVSKGGEIVAENYLWGVRPIASLLKHQPHRVLQLWMVDPQAPRSKEIVALAKEQDVPIERINKERLILKVGESANHQGIVAAIKVELPWDERRLYQEVEAIIESGKKILILVLDQIQDPHNLGACLRSADAFGVDVVVVPRHESSQVTPVVRKVASGAAETVAIACVANLSRALEQLQSLGVWTIGLAGEATQSLSEACCYRSCALVMGSEGEGLREQTRKHCDELAKIPIQGVVESLNVSVATGVALYEARRIRDKKGT